MPRPIHVFIFILLILLSEMSLGQDGSMEERIKLAHPLRKVGPRKVMVEVTLDYDAGGANCKHDPKKKWGNCGNGRSR